MAKQLEIIHPGEILLEEFMIPFGITQNKLARDIDVPVGRISEIVNNKRAITVDTALRLAVYFQTSAEFWLSLQTRYDLKKGKKEILGKIEKDVRPLVRVAA
ncbi:MAG TPA: HigA family addiction module antitoxin [Oligoflexia bacterium]|nr:HigA family addiction module antitoxin [Oligoflexia bacterium]HMP49241.1 HigA family addiction module antitoxin [Oligoflexia bacterium]